MAKIHEHLVELQHILKVPKGNYNEFGGYYSRSAEDILEALKEPLHERGLAILTPCVVIERNNGVYQQCTAILIDNEGNTIEVAACAKEHPEKKKLDNSQLSGAAMSYAKKYALGNLFAIDDTKDADQLEPENISSSQNLKKASIPSSNNSISTSSSPLASHQAISQIAFDMKKQLDEDQRIQMIKWMGENNLNRGTWNPGNKRWEGYNITQDQLELITQQIALIAEGLND